MVPSGIKMGVDKKRKMKINKRFVGNYTHKVDEKGRTVIPLDYREKLGANFIISQWLDNSLGLFPLDIWDQLAEVIEENVGEGVDVRGFVRVLNTNAHPCKCDSQGRIVMPQQFRQYAEINDEAFITAGNNIVEIWRKENWDEKNKESVENFSDIARSLGL